MGLRIRQLRRRPRRNAIAEHWNGKQWSQVPLPAGTTDGVIAASASAAKDVWAVTFLGERVLHYDGSKWKVAKSWSSSSNLPGELTGVTALSPTDVWAFGGSGYDPGLGTWHLSGTTWSHVTSGPGSTLSMGSAVSATDIWAIGGNGTPENAIVHDDGSNWSYVTAPALTGIAPRAILATAANDVWVVDDGGPRPKLIHYDGSTWSAVPVPWKMFLVSVTRDGSGGIWLAGGGASASWIVHRTSKGALSRIQVGPVAPTGIAGLAQIPGTTSVWGAGNKALKTGSAAAIWAYGKV